MTSESSVSSTGAVHELADGYLPEDDAVRAARERAVALGCAPVSTGVGNVLRFLTATLRARAVVEVGTGTGVSGLHLLAGMAEDGVLTSIDVEPEHQRAARGAFADAGVKQGRARLIMGRGLDVLPRLTDGGYDLVFVDAARAEYPKYHEQAVRLLRTGGVLGFAGVLPAGQPADAPRRDPASAALRELASAVREDERLTPVLLPVNGGLLLAARADPPG